MRLVLLVLSLTFVLLGCTTPDNNPLGQNRSNLTIAPTDLMIVPVEGQECTVGEPCTPIIAAAAGGEPPYTYQSDSFATGAPPMGVIVAMDGSLSGTPSREGEYEFGVCVKDATGTSKCAQATLVVNPARVQPAPDGLDEHGCDPTAGESWCDITQRCIGWGENCEAAKPPPQKESWSGTLEGTFDEHNGNYAPCLGNLGGIYSESFTISLTTDSSLAAALQSGASDWASGAGTFSGKETVKRQSPESYCRLAPGSASAQVSVTASIDSYNQKGQIYVQPEDRNSLWASSSFLSGTEFLAPHQRLEMKPTSVSQDSISGTWSTYPFGAKGTFTLQRS